MLFVLPSILLLLLAPQSDAGRAAQDRVLPLNDQSLTELVSGRNDRPLLVNVWATWCVPCVEEFPDLEKLHRTYGPLGLDVAVVSIDFEDEVTSKVVPFLAKVDATMPAYINAFPKPTDLIGSLDESWSGAVPATFVFDRAGKRVGSAIGKQSYEDFEILVTPLLPGPSQGRKVR